MAAISYSVPATGSSSTSITLPTGTTCISGWTYDWLSLVEEIPDAVWQLQDRRLRYGPFHVKKSQFLKSVYHRPKPVPFRQTILQPFRITRA